MKYTKSCLKHSKYTKSAKMIDGRHARLCFRCISACAPARWAVTEDPLALALVRTPVSHSADSCPRRGNVRQTCSKDFEGSVQVSYALYVIHF